MPSEVSVGLASIEDAEALAKLVNSAYRGESARAGWTYESDYIGGQRTDQELLERDIKDPNVQFLCIRQGKEIIACVRLQIDGSPSEVSVQLGMLSVKPTLQSRGLGKILVFQSEKWARSQGIERMTLSVLHVRDTLMQWYERLGYLRTKKTSPFPYGDLRTGNPYQPGYHFIIFEKNLK